MHRIEVAGQITFDDPAPYLKGTVLQLEFYGTDRMMHTALGPEPIGQTMKGAFPDRFPRHQFRLFQSHIYNQGPYRVRDLVPELACSPAVVLQSISATKLILRRLCFR